MTIVVVLLTLAACLSGNIPAILFSVAMLWLARHASRQAQAYAAFYLLFFVGYPQTFDGETDLDRNMPLLFSGLFLTHAAWTARPASIRLGRWQWGLLALLTVACLVVYLPIPIAALFSLNVWSGAAEEFVSNARGSYMLTFAVPLLGAPLVALGVTRSLSDQSDLDALYRFLKVLLWVVVLGSFARYALNADFIPQSYTAVRYEGNRLSAFMHPDSLGYGRRLLFPIALVSAYALSTKRHRMDLVLFFLLMVTVAMTLGRTTYASSMIVVMTVLAHNVGVKRVLVAAAVAATLVLALTLSGVIAGMVARSVGAAGGVALSGRGVIWGTAIALITGSPLVGLRPGGWVTLLSPGDVTFFGSRVAMQSAHSFYLQAALDWGLPVLALVIGLLIASAALMHMTARQLRHEETTSGAFGVRTWAVATEAAIAGLLVHGVSEVVPFYLLFFLIGLAWSLHYIARRPAAFPALMRAPRTPGWRVEPDAVQSRG